MVRSASSGENVAARLSPPDSTMTISSFGNRVSSSATAARLTLASSRIAAHCGQPPDLDADDPVERKRSRAQELGVFLRVDVVGDDGEIELGMESPAQPFDEGRLPRADRPADAEREDARLAP